MRLRIPAVVGRKDVFFELAQVVEAYDFYQKQMVACVRALCQVPSRARSK